ncbi:hypothetical protein DSO57_1005856 [Entomophthora muscae]|uniref:Uncharacterized protein n=1 Tax=Entomophthora muscae TaxID=34485 RepID=A0ACC2UTQ7_9FUNG|nr:hypothetical protein DSO57_1005856 [Entomophthora muscae]
MLVKKPQLQDSNPGILQAGSLQDQLPGFLRFYGLKLDQDSTSGKLLRPAELKLPASMPPTLNFSVSPANESMGLAKNPKITGAAAEGESKKLPVECRPPGDDQSCNPKGKFESSCFNPANERSPMQDATEGCLTIVDGITRPEGNCKSLPMSNHPQEVVEANKSTSTQLFRVMYIILTGIVDFMVPSNGPWAIIGKYLSYIVKLAPILWWALPSRPAGCPPASSQEPPTDRPLTQRA